MSRIIVLIGLCFSISIYAEKQAPPPLQDEGDQWFEEQYDLREQNARSYRGNEQLRARERQMQQSLEEEKIRRQQEEDREQQRRQEEAQERDKWREEQRREELQREEDLRRGRSNPR